MKEAKIKVLALLPMEPPKVVELDYTLEAMQKFVGGNIECLPLCDLGAEFTLVCNDEGKLLELPPNRMLWGGADYLAAASPHCSPASASRGIPYPKGCMPMMSGTMMNAVVSPAKSHLLSWSTIGEPSS